MLKLRADYQARDFPIRSSMTNNVPGLSSHSPGGIFHRFETQRAQAGDRVGIYERVAP